MTRTLVGTSYLTPASQYGVGADSFAVAAPAELDLRRAPRAGQRLGRDRPGVGHLHGDDDRDRRAAAVSAAPGVERPLCRLPALAHDDHRQPLDPALLGRRRVVRAADAADQALVHRLRRLPRVQRGDHRALPLRRDPDPLLRRTTRPPIDGISVAASHELVEASTDPLLLAGWIDNSVTIGGFMRLITGEAADICSGSGAVPTAPVRRGGVLVAPYWSNTRGACVTSSAG